MANIMNQMNPPMTAAERAQRSVFVGNIPYETTEEQLKEIFAQAGPVVSFRLVYDRETGKPKGYGFCEYQDVETAQSAMRNLNNYDFNGRPLRVGVAAGEQNKEEMKGMQQALGGPPIESPYGEPVEPEKAPEAISKAVASLPPEQMFELMKQMKLCIQNNPNEARNMLLQNPQLAYALLQAQIVMKIVDPQVALAMLYRDANQVPPSTGAANNGQPSTSAPNQMGPPQGGRGPAPGQGPGGSRGMGGPSGDMMGASRGPMPGMGGPMGGPMPGGHRDMGGPYPGQPQRSEFRDQRMMGDPRGMPQHQAGPAMQGGHGGQGASMRPQMVPAPQQAPMQSALGALGALGNLGNLGQLSAGVMSGLGGGLGGPGTQISPQDQEKAALIMQVLQLTDQQISMLPPEQRQSIIILKDQIAKSAQ
ncbi:cleavage stimulation factor subunit 2-like [Haliotis asinina]|uniref:cleavage stimulation factor subunit 2-like n=1 Tax=Haliotis asinina TaxID=109174 RepID=UPI00353249E6